MIKKLATYMLAAIILTYVASAILIPLFFYLATQHSVGFAVWLGTMNTSELIFWWLIVIVGDIGFLAILWDWLQQDNKLKRGTKATVLLTEHLSRELVAYRKALAHEDEDVRTRFENNLDYHREEQNDVEVNIHVK